MTFRPRFGSALNRNVHFLSVGIDGVFSVAGPTPVFYQMRGPTSVPLRQFIGGIGFWTPSSFLQSSA